MPNRLRHLVRCLASDPRSGPKCIAVDQLYSKLGSDNPVDAAKIARFDCEVKSSLTDKVANASAWTRSPATLGTFALIVAAFLPWFRFRGAGTFNSFDVRLRFLVDKHSAVRRPSPWDLGLVLVVAFAVCVVAALIPTSRH